MGIEATTQQLLVRPDSWRVMAACRQTVAAVEMVPGSDEDFGDAAEIQAAKRRCAVCPVLEACRDEAGQQAGVWAGLTLHERARLRLSCRVDPGRGMPVRQVIPCAGCGLNCAPERRGGLLCDQCLPVSARRRSVQAFKGEILAMIAAGASYRKIAEAFNLREVAVGRACRRWGHPSIANNRQARTAQLLRAAAQTHPEQAA